MQTVEFAFFGFEFIEQRNLKIHHTTKSIRLSTTVY